MNQNCEIARDLMPLSVDGVCSEGSQRFLDEHMAECKPCQDYFAGMKTGILNIKMEPTQESKSLKKSLRHMGKRFKALWITLTALICAFSLLLAAAGINQIVLHWHSDVPLDLYNTRITSTNAYASITAACQFSPMAYIDHQLEKQIIGNTKENLTGYPEAVILTYTLEYYPNQAKDYTHGSNCLVTVSDYELCHDGTKLYLVGGYGSATAEDGTPLLLLEPGLPVSEVRVKAGDAVETVYVWGGEFDILPEELDDYFYPPSRIMLRSDYEEMMYDR
ncbi:MAG: zf-HC2 domain-containing protein [Clostridiales bacterium]|nr:zf-HC2 domain-containing protein [Clostridiales bacterium]